MTELCGMHADSEAAFASSVKALIVEAKQASRKMIVANLREEQNTQYGKALQAAGFVHIGQYYGNSNVDVHTWIYGLKEPMPIAAKKPVRRALRPVKKAISR